MAAIEQHTMHGEITMCTSEIIQIDASNSSIGRRKIVGHIPIPCAKQSTSFTLHNANRHTHIYYINYSMWIGLLSTRE